MKQEDYRSVLKWLGVQNLLVSFKPYYNRELESLIIVAESEARTALIGQFSSKLLGHLRDRVGYGYLLRVSISTKLTTQANGDRKKQDLGYKPMTSNEFDTTPYPTLVVEVG